MIASIASFQIVGDDDRGKSSISSSSSSSMIVVHETSLIVHESILKLLACLTCCEQ